MCGSAAVSALGGVGDTSHPCLAAIVISSFSERRCNRVSSMNIMRVPRRVRLIFADTFTLIHPEVVPLLGNPEQQVYLNELTGDTCSIFFPSLHAVQEFADRSFALRAQAI